MKWLEKTKTLWIPFVLVLIPMILLIPSSLSRAAQSEPVAEERSVVVNSSAVTQTCTIPLTGLHITGPTTGMLGAAYVFSATVEPLSATLPITYTWQPTPTGGSGTVLLPTTHVATYTWHATGPQTITLTAYNCCNALTQTHTITISPVKIHLPVLLRAWPPASWHSQCVDCPSFIDDLTLHCIALDSAGQPHVAYGGDYLYHAWHDGAAWQIEVVDPGAYVGNWAAITLDGNDYAHISYYDGYHGGLCYAHWDGSAWITQTVDYDGGWDSAIALDSAGRPHIAYRDPIGFSSMDLKYAHWDGAAWQIETVEADISAASSRNTSIALDGADRPHIGYSLSSPGSDPGYLKHAYWDQSQWHFDIVTTAEGVGDNSMVLSSADQPHFVFVVYEGSATLVRHARRDGSGWQIATVASYGDLVYALSLGLDAGDAPRFSYYVNTDSSLRYAYQQGATWRIEVVESGSLGLDDDQASSLALDEAGRPHLVYHLRDDRIQYALRESGGWQIATVEQGGDAGRHSSLVLDGNDRPHVAYYDEGQGALKYAAWDGSAWRIQNVHKMSYQNQDDWEYAIGTSSLALDSAGRPHVVYHYNGLIWADELRYTHWDGSTWQTQVIVGTSSPPAEASAGASLALDDADRPHVFYPAPDSHRYAYWDGSAWRFEVVDGEVGGSNFPTSLVLDGAGRPHVAYFDAANQDLKYAYKDAAGWQRQTVDSQGYVGAYPALALDATGRPHLSYCLVENYKCEELRHAYYDGTAWHVETVDDVGQTGYYTSLATDSAGRPHISYYDGDNRALKYARWDGSQWQVETLAGGNVGWYTSLALDGAGSAHISHYDAAGGDLRYTWWGP